MDIATSRSVLTVQHARTDPRIAPDPAFVEPALTLRTLDTFLPRRAILDALTAQIPSLAGTLLDIGCGKKPYRSLLLRPPSRIERYIGLDLPGTAYAADERPDLEWDGHTIPLGSNSVDCAMSTEVLEQCPHPERLLAEAYRVLKPGGMLFFTVPFLWPIHDAPYDQFRYTPFALQRLLESAGFAQIDIRSFGGWDASLAQMIGVWVRRRPMPNWLRSALSLLALPLMRILIAKDIKPRFSAQLPGTVMITGLSGTAVKPRG